MADALLRAPALLGSLDVLGAPTRLIESVGAGFHDLVAMPAEAAAAGTHKSLPSRIGLERILTCSFFLSLDFLYSEFP